MLKLWSIYIDHQIYSNRCLQDKKLILQFSRFLFWKKKMLVRYGRQFHIQIHLIFKMVTYFISSLYMYLSFKKQSFDVIVAKWAQNITISWRRLLYYSKVIIALHVKKNYEHVLQKSAYHRLHPIALKSILHCFVFIFIFIFILFQNPN